MLSRITEWCRANREAVAVLAVTVFLVFFRISDRAFWMDENMVLHYLPLGPIEFWQQYLREPDNHPPLYYFLVLLASKVLPWTELTVRLVSALSGIGIVALVYVFAKRVFNNKHMAAGAAFLTAFSAYFVLLSQMARYHALTGFTALLTLYFFYRLYTEKQTRALIGYSASFAMLGWIDYPHFIYIGLITNIIFGIQWLRKRPLAGWKQWLTGQALVAMAFLPMVWMLYHRIFVQGDGGFEKVNLLGNSSLNIVAGILFHVYAFFFSENVLPWNAATFAAGCLVLLGVVWGLIVVARKRERGGVWFVAGLAMAVIVSNTLFLNVANPRYNFTVYPKFGFVAYPLCVIAFVGALQAIRSIKIRSALYILWVTVALVGLTHFYGQKNYLNPSYFNTFKAFETVRDTAVSGQYLAFVPDMDPAAYVFYQKKYFAKLIPVAQNQLAEVPAGGHVWYFATGSDDVDKSVDPTDKLPAGYRVISRFDSVPLDSTFKDLKQRFLHRPSYTFKYSLFLLEKL